MSLTVVIDASTTPAGFGVTASALANQLRLPLWSLTPAFAGDVPDSHQHVAAAGYCVTSGLWRSDTLLHELRDASQLPAAGAVIVLSPQQLAALPENAIVLHDHQQADSRWLSDSQGNRILTLWQDDFGRWLPEPQPARAGDLALALIGREADQREAYPATLAALGDAADALGIGLKLRFLPPVTLSATLSELDGAEAIVLPGGASMLSVPGQIRVAQASRQRKIPTLGLCLGMQSMATAAVQTQPGCEQATMAEVAGDAALHSFTRFDDLRHRCGLLPFSAAHPLDGGPLPELMHYNHRYRFNPLLRPALLASGVTVTSEADGSVDAITLPDHPFWFGVQGHPELQSRPGAPHPLFTALLTLALNRRG